MVVVRVAQLQEGRQWLILAPFPRTFGALATDQQQEVLTHLQSCVDHAKRSRMQGTVIIAWLDGYALKFAAPQSYSGQLPKLTWLELVDLQNHQVLCDDPIVTDQLPKFSLYTGRNRVA